MSDTPVNSGTPHGPASAPVDLTEFDEDYGAAEPLAYSEVPDGRYEVRMEDVRLSRSQKGDPMLTFDMVVLQGPQANRHVFKNSVITRASLPVVKGELERLGLVMERLSELSARLGELVGMDLKITKRTKDGFANVYFNRPTPPV